MSCKKYFHNKAVGIKLPTLRWLLMAFFLLCHFAPSAQGQKATTPSIRFDTITHKMCQGDTLRVRDSLFTTQGIYPLHIEYGDDSIYEGLIVLTVHPTFDTSFTAGICDGEAFTAFGFNERIPGDYVRKYSTNQGCDSIYKAHLVTATGFDSIVQEWTCSNRGYSWKDSVYTVSTTIVDSNHTTLGCDSIVHIHLAVDMAYDLYDTVRLCQGDTLLYKGTAYLPPCTVHDSMATQQGCDSIVHITAMFYDSLFHAEPYASLDGKHWHTNDTIFEGCEPMQLHLRHHSTGHNHTHWHLGNGEESLLDSLTHDYSQGLYTLVFIVESSDGCVDSVVFPDAIHVFTNPDADFIWAPETPPVEDEPEFQFFNLSDPQGAHSSYLWTFYNDTVGSTVADTSTQQHPAFSWEHLSPSAAGEYRVQLVTYYENEGLRGDRIICSDTSIKNIFITRTFLQFPNVVTPNDDGTNDVWSIVNLVEYNSYMTNSVTIYDRQGHVVYSRQNISYEKDFWDPNEHNCPDGTYFFRFTGEGPYGRVERKGVIEVFR